MKNRIIWKMFLLEIVTLGIYRLYYFVKTRREMMDNNPSIKIMNPWFLIAPIVVSIFGFVLLMGAAFYQAANTPGNSQSCRTYQSNNSSVNYGNCSSDSQTSGISNSDNQTTGTAMAIGAIANLVFFGSLLIAFILYVVWIWSYSQGVDKITAGKLSFGICLVILILVPDGIDILIVQDYFNKLPSPSNPNSPQGPEPPQQTSLPPQAPTPTPPTPQAV